MWTGCLTTSRNILGPSITESRGSILISRRRRRGCSGFSYSLGFDDKTDDVIDHVSEQHGLQVAVDKKSHLLLDGTTVDFHDGLEKRGFTFENPNATKSCGCGSSFSC